MRIPAIIGAALISAMLFISQAHSQPPDARAAMRDAMMMENNRIMQDTLGAMRDITEMMKNMGAGPLTPEQRNILDNISRRIDMLILQNQSLILRYQGYQGMPPSMPGIPR